MRLPNLKWPANLFTDAILPHQETVAMFPTLIGEERMLWKEMSGAWTVKRVDPEHQPRALMFDPDQIGL